MQITRFSQRRLQNDAKMSSFQLQQAIHDTDLLIQNMTLFHIWAEFQV